MCFVQIVENDVGSAAKLLKLYARNRRPEIEAKSSIIGEDK